MYAVQGTDCHYCTSTGCSKPVLGQSAIEVQTFRCQISEKVLNEHGKLLSVAHKVRIWVGLGTFGPVLSLIVHSFLQIHVLSFVSLIVHARPQLSAGPGAQRLEVLGSAKRTCSSRVPNGFLQTRQM